MPFLSGAASDRLSRHPRLAAAAALTVAFAGFFALFTPGFEGQDDVVLTEIVNGRYTGSPSPYLVFVHILLGRLWVWLYQLSPALPWYALSLYAAHVLSWSLIARAGLELDRSWRGWAVLGAGFATLGLPILVKPQFTSSSLLCFAAGLFYFMVMSRGGLRWRPASLAALAALASALLRPQAFQASVVFASPWILTFAWIELRAGRRPWRELAVGALIIAGGLGLGWLHDLAHERDQGWRRFIAFNMDMSEISTRPRVDPKLYGGLEDIGLTANDTELMYCVFYPDAELFSPQRVREARLRIEDARKKLKLSRAWKRLREQLRRPYHLELIFLLAFALFVLPAINWERRLILAALIGGHLFLLTIFHWRFERFPYRILQPSFIYPFLGAAFAVGAYPAGPRPWPSRVARSLRLGRVFCLSVELQVTPGLRRLAAAGGRVLSAAALALMVLGCAATQVGYARYHSRLNTVNQRQHLEELRRIRRLDPNGVFLAWGAIGFFRTPPFSAPAELPPLNSIHATWLTLSPHWDANKKRFALDDVALDLARREDVYLIGDRFSIELYKTFMREHHRLEVEARPLAPIQRCFVDIKAQGHSAETCQCVLTVFEVRPRRS